MKSNYDKKQNRMIVLLFCASITLTAGLTAALVKSSNKNANKIEYVQKQLLDVESMLSKKEAEYIFNSNDFEEDSDIFKTSLKFDKETIKKYKSIYFYVTTYVQSSGNYYKGGSSVDMIVLTSSITKVIDEDYGTYNQVSIFSSNTQAILGISRYDDSNYYFYVTYIPGSSDSNNSCFFNYILGIY